MQNFAYNLLAFSIIKNEDEKRFIFASPSMIVPNFIASVYIFCRSLYLSLLKWKKWDGILKALSIIFIQHQLRHSMTLAKFLSLFCQATNLNKKIVRICFFYQQPQTKLQFPYVKRICYKEQAHLLNSVMLPSGWWEEIQLVKNICLSMIASYFERSKTLINSLSSLFIWLHQVALTQTQLPRAQSCGY